MAIRKSTRRNPTQRACASTLQITLLVYPLSLSHDLLLLTINRHIHRADLHRGLLAAAEEAGCVVHLDSRVVSIDPYKPSLKTKNGTVFEGDLIVASDGMSPPL